MFAVVPILVVRGTFAPSLPVGEAGGSAIEAGAAGHRIRGRVYLSEALDSAAPLIVVLHGDAPGRKPSYQYIFSAQVAAARPGARVVALLRPGYADPFGAKSDGDRGLFSAGENYTPAVVHDMAEAIGELKARWSTSTLILVGHSGGSVLSADIAALYPGLVQHAFLVSCPCDVPAFRQHMARIQRNPVWMLPADSLSALQTLDEMSPAVTVTAISGTNDPIALPEYARRYVDKARGRGIMASLVLLQNQEHEILLNKLVVHLAAQAK